jgi:hypothetical protein
VEVASSKEAVEDQYGMLILSFDHHKGWFAGNHAGRVVQCTCSLVTCAVPRLGLGSVYRLDILGCAVIPTLALLGTHLLLTGGEHEEEEGDPCYTHSSNAYMLVYVRKDKWDDIMCAVGEDDLPVCAWEQ